MSDLALVWHGSLQWGRRRVSEWPFLVHPYCFSGDPAFELTLRISTGPGAKARFAEWQSAHDHPPILRLGRPPVQASSLPWTRGIPPLDEVNPYF